MGTTRGHLGKCNTINKPRNFRISQCSVCDWGKRSDSVVHMYISRRLDCRWLLRYEIRLKLDECDDYFHTAVLVFIWSIILFVWKCFDL